MNVITKILILTACVFIGVQCCWKPDKENNKIRCDTIPEIVVEGNDTWTYLSVYNENRKLYVRKNAFRRTPNLVKLEIQYFSGIEKGALNGLTKLDDLEFYQFKGDEFPLGVLDNLPIRRLIMNDMDMTHILPGLFDKLPELGILTMDRNKVTEIKESVFTGTSMIKIYIDYNQVDTIEPKAFANMQQLLHLSFTGNKLTAFNSEEIFGGKSYSLTHIWLDENKIKIIQKNSFSAVPFLSELKIDFNEIESIEEGAFDNNSKLDLLDLSNNKLMVLQPEIFPAAGLPKLLVFHLHNNRLTFLDKSTFLRLPILKYISFGANPLQCSCLDNFYMWMRSKNMVRICDSEYTIGNRPACIIATNNSTECLHDTNLTQDLYEIYSEIEKEYSIVPVKCDTLEGANHAYTRNY